MPAIALLVFATFAACYVIAPSVYFVMLWIVGVEPQPLRYPFIDTQFVMAQIECWKNGIDVYASNPCDALGRLHDYSPLWLRATFLPVERRWTYPLGLSVDLIFLSSLICCRDLNRKAEIFGLSF